MSIGENLRKIRELKGITQCELSGRIGITQSMLCQLERGTKTLSLPLAKEISDVLDCSVDDFYKSS